METRIFQTERLAYRWINGDYQAHHPSIKALRFGVGNDMSEPFYRWRDSGPGYIYYPEGIDGPIIEAITEERS